MKQKNKLKIALPFNVFFYRYCFLSLHNLNTVREVSYILKVFIVSSYLSNYIKTLEILEL